MSIKIICHLVKAVMVSARFSSQIDVVDVLLLSNPVLYSVFSLNLGILLRRAQILRVSRVDADVEKEAAHVRINLLSIQFPLIPIKSSQV